MKKMSIEEFRTESNIEIIMELMKNNNGYVTSKMVTELGLSREYLSILQRKNIIERIDKGIYLDVNSFEDSFYTFSLRFPNIVFSHMTALYFYNLAEKAPYDKYDITIFQNYHNSRLSNHEIFYVSEDMYELGLTQTVTPNGNKVKSYDMERCICDIIRSKKRMDIEHIKYSVKEYLKRKDKNLNKLSIYAEKMGIKNDVMDFVSLMYE